MSDLGSVALEAAPKAAWYLAVLLVVGAFVVRSLVLPQVQASAADAGAAERRLGRLALTAAFILAVALLVRLVAHTAAAFGVAGSLSSADALRTIALESQWGGGWRAQAGAGVLVLAAAIIVQFHRRVGWALAALGALGCIVALPLLGHAAGSPQRSVLHGAHALGAGVWLGSLACLLFAGHIRASLFPKFAPIALSGGGVAAATGVLIALQYLASPSDLWSTAYGRVLTVKILIVVGVVVCGYVNWRQWGQVTDPELASTRVAAIEVALAFAAVLITAFLTELEHP